MKTKIKEAESSIGRAEFNGLCDQIGVELGGLRIWERRVPVDWNDRPPSMNAYADWLRDSASPIELEEDESGCAYLGRNIQPGDEPIGR